MEKSSAGDKDSQVLAQFEICVFKIPPCQDVIAIGRRAPIGKHAVEIMLEAIAPEIFQAVALQHPTIEVLVVRKAHVNLFGKDRLVQMVVREIEGLMDETAVLNIGLNARLTKSVTFNFENNENH